MAFGPPPAWGGFVPGNGRPVRGFWDGDDIPASPIPRGPAGFPGMGGPPPQNMFSPRPMPVPMPGGGPRRGLRDMFNGLRGDRGVVGRPPRPDLRKPRRNGDPPGAKFVSRAGGFAGLPRVVVGDFGCAVSLKEIQNGREQEREQPCGTPAWYPPEGQGKRSYGTKTDIWTLGLTIFCLCRLVYNPSMRGHSRENLCGRAYSRELNALVRLLTASDMSRRPPARDIASAALKILKEKMQK